MSNIYIQEPPPDGKVCLETTAGDIDIELWSREAPKACRNFVQLCMEGYYDGTIFHRLVKGFIVQGGDPTGTGTGGNSIWGKPFKDEFHSRLRFMRRGLVAMANAGRNDNGSQFFFTLGPTPELQNKHTVFAKVGGNTIYNMLKLEEGLTDENEKPLYPHKIVKTKVLSNPFDDIVPRESIKKVKDDKKDKNKSKAAATKNYKLLSFGEEAEEDEEEVDEVNKRYSGKSKSIHDLENDPKLSSEPAVETAVVKKQKEKSSQSSDSASNDSESGSDDESHRKKKKPKRTSEPSGDDEDKEKSHKKVKDVESVREKLKRKEEKERSPKKDKDSVPKSDKKTESGSASKKDDDDDGEYYLGKEEKMEQKRKVEALRKEYKDLRRSIKQEQKVEEKEAVTAANEAAEKAAKLAADNNVIKEFMDEQEKYKQVKAKAPKKGEDREAATLAMLAKFKSKIETAKETFGEKELPPPSSSSSSRKDKLKDGEDADEEEEADDISWLARKLQNENKDEVLAKDANKKSDDWFDIFDPRNALTKRRRENAMDDSKEKKRAKINR